ncbi:MAG: dihydrolipoamide acetyltransferase family protein [Planctomycetota bacterium]
MPRLSDTMEAGTIIKWNVKEGDQVSAGDVIADVETDKATMEMQAFDDGQVAAVNVPEGQQVDVGTVIAVLAEDGEDLGTASSSAGNNGATAPAAAAAPVEVTTPPAAAPSAPRSSAKPTPREGGRIRVSPVARRLAEDHQIDLTAIQGSGPGGRIIKRDVLSAISAQDETTASIAPAAKQVTNLATTATPLASTEIMVPGSALTPGAIPLSNMRQTIAKRLVESKQTIPHYQVTANFDMDPLIALRSSLNEQLEVQSVKLSVNDFIVKACALAIHQHPAFNASWGGDHLLVHHEVNVGVAVALPEESGGGLVVATIRHADQKSLRVISAETKSLAEKARTRGLTIDEMSDSTFTISNLGMFGIEHFTAIINPPNSAILAVGASLEQPVVRDGELAVGHVMRATLSLDHRIIDGAMAAAFMQTLKQMIEHPGTLLV